MSYNTDLQSNNTDLQAILDAVNALPNAGGGLPDGIGVLSCGTFTLTSDRATLYNVEHGLKQAPNFVMVIATGEITNSAFQNCIYSYTCIGQSYTYNTAVRTGEYVVRYGASSTSFGSTALSLNSSSESTYLGATTFTIPSGSTRRLKANVTYQWIAGVLNKVD